MSVIIDALKSALGLSKEKETPSAPKELENMVEKTTLQLPAMARENIDYAWVQDSDDEFDLPARAKPAPAEVDPFVRAFFNK